MNPIKFDDPVLGKLDELLGSGLFRTETRTIGPEVEKAMQSGDGAAFAAVLADLDSLKSISPESVIATPVLRLGAFALLAADPINKQLARYIEVPHNAPKIQASFFDICLMAAKHRGDFEHCLKVVNDRLALSSHGDDLVATCIDTIINRQLTTMRHLVSAGENPINNMLTEWRNGETMFERITRENAEQEAKLAEATERRRKRQHAAGFSDEDIADGLADDIK